MSFKIRAAAVTVATSLVAVPLALAGTAFAQEDQPATGHIGGYVFNDYNGDGVKQENEPGIRDVNVTVKGPGGTSEPSSTNNYGVWTVKRAPLGKYEVSYVDPKLGNTTPSTVQAEITATDAPTVSFGVRGGSICGVAWMDTNEDGKRQPGEGPLAGRMIYLSGTTGPGVETKADGVYCFDGLAAGEHRLFSSRRQNDPLVLVKGGGDSKFDWVSAVSQPVVVGKGEQVKGIDAGYMKLRSDLKAVQLLINRDGQVTSENNFRVGDVIEIYGSLMANGNAPQVPSGTLTLPEGLRVQTTLGGLGANAVVNGQRVVTGSSVKSELGLVEFLGVRVVVEKGFADGEIKWELSHDSDLSNNLLTRKISAVAAAVPHNDAPNTKTPEVKKTAGLANTGVDPVAAGAIGLGALALGGLAVYGARRRQNT